MKKIILCALLCTLLNAGMAFATQNWVQLADKMYVDTNSLRKESYDRYSLWLKQLNDNSAPIKSIENAYNTKIWYRLDQILFDCGDKQFRLKSYYTYDLDGKVINNESFSEYDSRIKWDNIPPASVGEWMYNYACQYSGNN